MTPPIPTAFENGSSGPRQAAFRPVPVPLQLSNHVNPQTREDGSYLFGPANYRRPQVRLPPLDRFDEFTIRQLYSPIVADMIRMHPEIVSWIGESAIEMIESLATREHILENEIIKEVADLRLNFQVMKAELGEKRSKQLQQRALKELNSIKREMDTMSQSSLPGLDEQIASTAIHSLRSQLPQNTALGSGDPISMNVSQSHPYDHRGDKTSLSIVPNPALIPDLSPGSRRILPESETHISGFSGWYPRTNGPFGAYSEGRTFLNCGTPELNFTSESPRPLFKPSYLPQPLPSLDGKSRQVSSPRQTIMFSPAQYSSPYGQDRPLTTSTGAFNKQDLTSGGANVIDFGNNQSTGSLPSGPRSHQSFGGTNAFAYTSHHCMPTSEARTLTAGKEEQLSKRKRPSNLENERYSYRNAKKAKVG